MIEAAKEMADRLRARGFTLATAESCTGGMIAAELTSIAGSSEWFECAFVTYQVRAKIDMLGVNPATVQRHTVVSEPVAREMAIGAIRHCQASVAVSVTGIAGPGGGDIVSPVGTVWLAWAIRDPEPVCVQASEFEFDGDREAVRRAAVMAAIEGVNAALSD